MKDFEKLGVFYLGRRFDPAAAALTDEPILYDSKDLTTHAVCVGMTGSGKTGLCLSLLEEAAIDGVPAIAIDPKGDLGNLLLAFPELQPADFRPWVDAGEAARQGISLDDYAAQVASTWRNGLSEWGQDGARIARYRDAVDIAIYTPGSEAGLPLSVLRSFAAPADSIDTAAMRERIGSVVSGLLSLIGVDADPLKSREHILLASVFEQAWAAGRSLDLPAIISAVQKPGFDKIGVFDLESFFPAKERLGLAMALNNLLASPGFSAWMSGEPLDIQRLLFTAAGRPRLSILSIAHLNDAERMFFVTLLLNELIAWMRAQSGTSSLRAVLYMDEIFGYFPPSAQPPSKLPMLTLLKQARAYGVGVVLATQNPVDLDYKGLANAGTWLIGRLQTERDKMRVIEGLEGALAGGTDNLDRAALDSLMSQLASRVFLMRNVHDDQPVLLKSRWALSYLRGPLTQPEIQKLMGARKQTAAPSIEAASDRAAASASPPHGGTRTTRPMLGAAVTERFLKSHAAPDQKLTYSPRIAASTRMHFVDAKAGVDVWQEAAYVAPLSEDGQEIAWDRAQCYADLKSRLDTEPRPAADFEAAPGTVMRAQSYTTWSKALTAHLQQYGRLSLRICDALQLTSQPAESEGEFRARLALGLREKRDAGVTALRKKYEARLTSLQDQIRRAQERVAREQSQYSQQKMQSAISVGATILGALFGGGRRGVSVGTIGRAATAVRSTGRIGREHQDVERASESVAVLEQRLAALNGECEREIQALQTSLDPQSIVIRELQLSPRKGDITVGGLMLLWQPVPE